MSNKSVVIVGAGIVGFSTAYYLNKQGIEVTILDQTDGNNNCSFGNAGYVSPSHLIPLASPGIISQGIKWMLNSKSPFYIKPKLDLDLMKWGMLFKKASTDKRVKEAIPVLYELTYQSQKLYEELLAEEQIDAGYHKPGLLMICQKQDTLHHEEELVKLAQSFGLEAETLTREETEKLEPNVNYNMAGSVYFGCDAWMTPNVFMKKFEALLVERGVNIQYNTTLKDIKLSNGKVSEFVTNTGAYQADEFVIAAGSWSPLLMKKLKLSMPLQAGKGYSFMIKEPIKMPKLPSILVEGRIATTPMLHGWRIAGTMEMSGINHQINQNRVAGIIEAVKQAIPDYKSFDFSEVEPWAGLRPCTPDGLPYIGRVSGLSNLQVGTGHAMLGWTLGPITGKLLTEQIVGEKASVSSPLLAVERYN
ncbi:NAD(P)/FAD-dependent oxidoreductase [Roseivirga pacifica]|uniref:NAD(P)/FAD-dependent oxidoreductase n=1 Tax=Roseivirga pacifica TaxID=1267423 RepID=UPI003BAD96A4